MKNLGGGSYEAITEVQSGAIIRYSYDRHDGTNCCDSDVTREALGERFRMQYRFLLAEDGLQRVNDAIGTWNDLREPHIEGKITGRVTDRITGAPIFDADVSISGIHVGTRVDGSYKIEGLPPGEHTVIAHSDTGDFLPAQSVVVIIGNHSEIKDLTVSPTKLVPVTFEVVLPDSTPENAWVKIGGNISSLGARIAHPSRPLSPDNYFLPLLEREGNTAFDEFMLPEGAVIEYFYTIGPIGVTNERGAQGATIVRTAPIATLITLSERDEFPGGPLRVDFPSPPNRCSKRIFSIHYKGRAKQ